MRTKSTGDLVRKGKIVRNEIEGEKKGEKREVREKKKEKKMCESVRATADTGKIAVTTRRSRRFVDAPVRVIYQ